MNASFLWIIFPLIISIIAWVFKEKRNLVIISVGIISFLLALFALTSKLDVVFSLGPLAIEINPSFTVLGRSFIFQDSDRFILGFLFGLGALWIFGSRQSSSNVFFVPHSLAIIALMVAALTIQPFLYAAFFIEMGVLISIPMLIKPGETITQGVLRFLIFQTMAVPFILFAGWGFENAPASVNSQQQNIQAAILLGLGFSFWLAVFPFYTWVPLLATEGEIYAAGFVFSTLPSTALLLIMEFYNNFAWLREEFFLSTAVGFIGTIMIVTGGIWAAFQRSITKLFGYAVIVDVGFSLLAFSLATEEGWQAYVLAFIPRAVTIAVIALAISILRKKNNSDKLEDLQGIFYEYPIASLSLLIGWFSFCGLPLLASFPVRVSILTLMAEQSMPFSIWAGLGSFGLFFAGFRLLAIIFRRGEDNQTIAKETRLQIILLSVGNLLLLLFGLLPSQIIGIFLRLLDSYKNLT